MVKNVSINYFNSNIMHSKHFYYSIESMQGELFVRAITSNREGRMNSTGHVNTKKQSCPLCCKRKTCMSGQ